MFSRELRGVCEPCISVGVYRISTLFSRCDIWLMTCRFLVMILLASFRQHIGDEV